MTLETGTRLGAYEIHGLLGSGGMGEVYRARDTRLNREVALKVLPAAFRSDPDRLKRFEREARVLASLNHPHIAVIHGLEDDGGVRAIVMELVEGPTLAERTDRGALDVAESLRVASQIANGLDAAHRSGIVHRDLKPANIKIRSDGTVKILDFGLAKAGAAPGDAVLSQTPTLSMDGGTRAGVILGTAAYMSPEQVRGQAVDARADVWAFACVLFEMLAGKPAFSGTSIADTFAAILERQPDWRALPGSTPRPVIELLRRALAKDIDTRVRDMGEVRLLLASATNQEQTYRSTPSGPRRGLMIAALAGAAALAVWTFANRAAVPAGSGVDAPAARAVAAAASVAVLPFANVTAQPDNDYLADGLAQQLMTRLAKHPDLRVVSRTSAFAFKGQNRDVREIANQLNVASVVEGSLHSAGDRLRVSVQLTDAKTGFQLWSDEFDRDATDIFAIESEISRAIERALTPASTAKVGGSSPTSDLQAYDLFLRGQYLLAQRTRDGLLAAEDLFRQAVARDPEFGAAWAALAEAAIPLHEIHGVRDQDQTYAIAGDAARRAISAGRPAPEGHAALAHIHMHQYRWSAAVEEATLALTSDPGSAIGHEWHGWALMALGRMAESEKALRRSIELDPLTGSYHYELAVCLLATDQPGEAVRSAERGMELGAGISVLPAVLGHVQLGRVDAARQALDRAPKDTPLHIRSGLEVYVLASSGRAEDARRRMQTLVSSMREGDERAPMAVPFAYAALGDRDRAVSWIRQSQNAGEFLVEFRFVREMRALLNHPTMRALLRELDLQPQ